MCKSRTCVCVTEGYASPIERCRTVWYLKVVLACCTLIFFIMVWLSDRSGIILLQYIFTVGMKHEKRKHLYSGRSVHTPSYQRKLMSECNLFTGWIETTCAACEMQVIFEFFQFESDMKCVNYWELYDLANQSCLFLGEWYEWIQWRVWSSCTPSTGQMPNLYSYVSAYT